MNISGFSHVTLWVSDLARSLRFYCGVLNMELAHHGEHDAYLLGRTAWVCLQEQRELSARSAEGGVDHVAFHIEEGDFPGAVAQLHQANIPIVRGPIQRGLGWSINFLDPDGTQLELHTSTLKERLTVWR